MPTEAEFSVRWADVQPQFGECVAVKIDNLGADKGSWAIFLQLNSSSSSQGILTHFSGGSIDYSGEGLILRPYVGQVLAAGATTQFCYCTHPGRAYPIAAHTQWFPGKTVTYTGLPTLYGTLSPVTLTDSTVGVVLEANPLQDVRGTVGGCATLTFTNTNSTALNIDKVRLTLNGSGVSPQFWPDFVTAPSGGSELTIDFPNSWMPLEAGKSIPLALCMSGRMPSGASYTLGN